jgi:hypothetical protein
MFDAFVSIYRSRTADLVRLATGGSGVLPEGHLHPDLVNRLAREAAETAEHILLMAIRALDCCPPVDITFGEYLRALVTCDCEHAPDDPLGYRLAVIEAFRRRGIYPPDVRTLAVDALHWRPPSEALSDFAELVDKLKSGWWPPDTPESKRRSLPGDRPTVGWQPNASRAALDRLNHDAQAVTWWWIKEHLAGAPPAVAHELGLALGDSAPRTIERRSYDGVQMPVFEVHSVRNSHRPVQRGRRTVIDVVIEITQRRRGYFDPKKQSEAEKLPSGSAEWGSREWQPDFLFRGGCTLLIDGETGRTRYAVVKHIDRDTRLARQRDYLLGQAAPSLRATYLRPTPGRRVREPFALLHRHG